MSIFRTVHDKENPYYIKNRAAANDTRLSFKAKGIHDYLMSKPDHWTVNESELQKAATDGLSAVRSGVQELIKLGYMSRVKVDQDPTTGRFAGYETHVYEAPELNPTFDFPTSENPTVGKSHTSNYISVVSNDKEISSFATAKATPQQQLFAAICETVGWDYKTLGPKERGQVAQLSGILTKAGYTLAHVQAFRPWWDKNDWRGKKGDAPNLSQLRVEIAKVTIAPAAPVFDESKVQRLSWS